MKTARLTFALAFLALVITAGKASADCQYCYRVLNATVPWCSAADYGTPGGSTDCHLVTTVSLWPPGVSVNCVEEGTRCDSFVGPPYGNDDPYGGGGDYWPGLENQITCSFYDASGECWG
jgi:hypothetical protein